MWNLQQDSRAIARLIVGAFRAAMPHILQYFQGGLYDLVRLLSMNVYDHSYSTSVVLISGVIQTLLVVKMIVLSSHLLTLCLCISCKSFILLRKYTV